MVRSAQKKFVIYSAVIVLLIITVIFIASCIIQERATNHSISISLHNAQKYFEGNDHDNPTPGSLFAQYTMSPNDKTPFINECVYDKHHFEGINLQSLINKIAKECETSTTGNVDNVYFSVKISADVYMVYAVDATPILEVYHSNIIKALIFLSILYVLLVLLLLWLSSIVFKPIVDNFQRQKQFVSDASHELKTPLSIINASVDVIASKDENNKWIDNVKAQTSRMNVLITDMLSLAKLDEGKITIHKENFNLSDVILECALPFEAMVYENGKTIEYMVSPDIKVNTDKNSVKMLVNILLDNAVKYADENGKIIVYLSKVKNKTIFSIYNTGSNVPDKDSARIFERFYRADPSRSRDSGGSGLGLAIAKNLANGNKWKIYAKSKQCESMTITVIF